MFSIVVLFAPNDNVPSSKLFPMLKIEYSADRVHAPICWWHILHIITTASFIIDTTCNLVWHLLQATGGCGAIARSIASAIIASSQATSKASEATTKSFQRAQSCKDRNFLMGRQNTFSSNPNLQSATMDTTDRGMMMYDV